MHRRIAAQIAAKIVVKAVATGRTGVTIARERSLAAVKIVRTRIECNRQEKASARLACNC